MSTPEETKRGTRGRQPLDPGGDGHAAPAAPWLSRLVQAAPCALYIYNLETERNDYVNPAYTAVTGWDMGDLSQMSPRACAALFHPEERGAVREHLRAGSAAQGAPSELVFRLRTKDQRWIWCLGRSAPLPDDKAGRRVIGALVDITRLKRQEQVRLDRVQELRELQRLESLGALAGGIAHDFNNVLTGIMGHTDLAMTVLPADSAAQRHLREVMSGAEHAAQLAAQMLALSGKGRFVVEPLDLSELVRSITSVLAASVPGAAELRYELASALPSVRADASQLKQVTLNLVMNAAEALEDGAGHVVLRTGAVRCEDADLAGAMRAADATPGDYVYLEVSDSGRGIDPQVLGRIFDPYYSTKPAGRGLGLSAVLGVIKGHHGALRCETGQGGTTFRVLLPAEQATPAAMSHPPTRGRVAEWRGSGCVLVIDDEQALREVLQGMLDMLGFEVLTAPGGREGLELFAQRAEAIRLVMLDMTMPGIGGAETLRRLRALDRRVPVIMMSGFSQEEVSEIVRSAEPAWFLKKPFVFERLRRVIQGALDARAEGARPTPSG